jgi:hypothetical protein
MSALTRPRDERGATTIVVALFMTTLLITTGLSLDVGNAYLNKSKMQAGADNAALAVARDCALAKASCSTAPSGAPATAGSIVTQNASGATTTTTLNTSAGTVSVKVDKSVPFGFMKSAGLDSKAVSTKAKASWNHVPVEGYPIFPLAVAWCDYQSRKPGSGAAPALFRADLALLDRSYNSCPNPDGTGTWNSLEGSLWLTNLFGINGCRYKLTILARINAVITTLLGAPFFCDSTINALVPGKTYMLPVYRSITWVPVARDLTIEVVGFVPVKLHAWRFTYITGLLGDRRYFDASVPNCDRGFLGTGPCNGITATFVRTVQKQPDFVYGPGTNLGAAMPVLVGE